MSRQFIVFTDITTSKRARCESVRTVERNMQKHFFPHISTFTTQRAISVPQAPSCLIGAVNVHMMLKHITTNHLTTSLGTRTTFFRAISNNMVAMQFEWNVLSTLTFHQTHNTLFSPVNCFCSYCKICFATS